MKKFLWVLFLPLSLFAQKTATVSKLKFISEYEVPHNLQFKGTTIGGLSGIDYDPKKGVYYLISDDRSSINAARFYTAKIFFNTHKIDSVQFVDVNALLDPSGKPYPNSKQDAEHTPDPEAMRYNPVSNQMIWTSEGERIVDAKRTVIENPAITMIDPSGKFIDTFPLPPNLRMQKDNVSGPRRNGVLEGLSFANNYKTLFVSLEEPLVEDGPRAEYGKDNKPYIRLFRFDMTTKKNTAQYAYKLDPIAHAPLLDSFSINGIPDILWISQDKMLVMERSFSTGRLACTIKIFEAGLKGATDIRNNTSLKDHPPAKPVKKKLLLNLDELGIYTDNVEGMTFGPTLPNGHRSLMLVSDNNFEAREKTQFFLFEVIP